MHYVKECFLGLYECSIQRLRKGDQEHQQNFTHFPPYKSIITFVAYRNKRQQRSCVFPL